MNNNNGSLAIGMAVLFEIIVIVNAAANIVSGQRKGLAMSILAIVCLTLPFIITGIAYKKKILLPSSFLYITLIYIFLAQYFGEIKRFYDIFWWWDLFLHAIFGSYTVIVGIHSINGIIRKEEELSMERFNFFVVTFAFCLSITLGTLWEAFEFTGDYLFKSHMVKGGLEDTMSDIIVKLLSAFITSIIFYIRLKNRPHLLS